MPDLDALTDLDLIALRVAVEQEMTKRGLAISVGDMAEVLAIEHFNSTPGLPNLQKAPKGTKNVDALSRDGDRYSIKGLQKARKTGTVYPDPNDKKKQLFEYILVVKLDANCSLESIYQFDWQTFCKVRSWDKRMNAWYVSPTKERLAEGKLIYVNKP